MKYGLYRSIAWKSSEGRLDMPKIANLRRSILPAWRSKKQVNIQDQTDLALDLARPI